jgi:hypothetical protein
MLTRHQIRLAFMPLAAFLALMMLAAFLVAQNANPTQSSGCPS